MSTKNPLRALMSLNSQLRINLVRHVLEKMNRKHDMMYNLKALKKVKSMTNYYFGTAEERKGNKEYTNSNYKAALTQYKEAQRKLIKMGSQRNFKKDAPYQDALAYVLGEIIITTAEIALDCSEKTLNNTKITAIWALIPGLCSDMDALYNQINHNANLNTNEDRVNTVYKALTDACKKIGSELINSIKNPAKSTDRITNAIDWFLEAEKYLNKTTNDAISIDLHFDHLERLESGFERTQDHQFIKKIKAYLDANSLLQLTSLSREEQFKTLYYQFLTLIKNENESAHDLGSECKALIELSRELTKEHPFVLKFNQLTASLGHEEHLTVDSEDSLTNQEARISREDSDEEVLAKRKNQQPCTKSKIVAKTKNIANDSSTDTDSDTDNDPQDSSATRKSRDAKKVAKKRSNKSTIAANSELVIAETLSEFSQISSDNDPGLSVLTKRLRNPDSIEKQQTPAKIKKNSADVPPNNCSSSQQPAPTNSVLPSQKPFTFFTPSRFISTSTAPLHNGHHVVFKNVIVEITKMYNDSDLLVNLLSLIGDFYALSNPSLLLGNISSMSAPFREASNKAENRRQDSSSIFAQAIKNNIAQIQEIPNMDARDIDKLFDNLVTFITSKSNASENIPQRMMAELISIKYKLALLEQANSLNEEINPVRSSFNME